MTNRFTDISPDIETLGVIGRVPILSVGMVKFNRDEVETPEAIASDASRTFYARLRLEEALKFGVVSASTLRWWVLQNTTAANEAFNGDQSYTKSAVRAAEFFDHGGYRVWGNGSDFDNAKLADWLQHILEFGDKDFPWRHSNNRDLRTFEDAAVEASGWIPENDDLDAWGNAHSALDDAIRQAVRVQRAWKCLARK